MRSILPFEIKYSPISKLALIPFEKKPDTTYRCFELQYIDGETQGKGYRIIAYRNDNYVDVYDDEALYFEENERFDVAENGLHKHVQTTITNVIFQKMNNQLNISFAFQDIEHRKIIFQIEEKTNSKTKPMNLLAPIGVGSKKPNSLPVFFMYDFDFIRKKSTIECSIDGKTIDIDRFPIPMNGQMRLFARYSEQCELFEFGITEYNHIKEVELDDRNTYKEDNVEYIFCTENVLEKVIVHFKENKIPINFNPVLNLKSDCSGSFTIVPKEQMGYIQGEYQLHANSTIILKIDPKDGWVPVANSLIAKMILNKKSVFCNWSKKYRFQSIINLENNKIESQWENGNIE